MTGKSYGEDSVCLGVTTEIYVVPKSLTKKDWLICSACGLPQELEWNCCLDVNCCPHCFRVDQGCIHCGFSLKLGADPTGYDVEAGKIRVVATSDNPAFLREGRQEAIKDYNEAS